MPSIYGGVALRLQPTGQLLLDKMQCGMQLVLATLQYHHKVWWNGLFQPPLMLVSMCSDIAVFTAGKMRWVNTVAVIFFLADVAPAPPGMSAEVFLADACANADYRMLSSVSSSDELSDGLLWSVLSTETEVCERSSVLLCSVRLGRPLPDRGHSASARLGRLLPDQGNSASARLGLWHLSRRLGRPAYAVYLPDASSDWEGKIPTRPKKICFPS
jgi:hypothetical protein